MVLGARPGAVQMGLAAALAAVTLTSGALFVRASIPASQALARQAAAAWPAPVDKAARADWSSADAAAVARNEGRPVVAQGTFLLLRHEGVESPNCHDATARQCTPQRRTPRGAR